LVGKSGEVSVRLSAEVGISVFGTHQPIAREHHFHATTNSPAI